MEKTKRESLFKSPALTNQSTGPGPVDRLVNMVNGFDFSLFVDPHFSHVSLLDRRDSLFICEKLIFRKKSLSRHLFYFYFKGKIKQEIKP